MGIPTAFSKLQQERTRLHGPRKRKHIDPGRASPLQDAGASIRRGAGSDHIVDDAIRLPASSARGRCTRKAPATLRRRCAGESPTWLGVRLTRASIK